MSDQIAQIDTLMQRYGITAFDYREGGTVVSLRRDKPGQTGAKPAEAVLSPGGRTITAPAFGHFYQNHPATSGPANALPRRVKKDETVGYLAVGPILRPVIAGRDCMLHCAVLPEGALAGFGDVLFEI